MKTDNVKIQSKKTCSEKLEVHVPWMFSLLIGFKLLWNIFFRLVCDITDYHCLYQLFVYNGFLVKKIIIVPFTKVDLR